MSGFSADWLRRREPFDLAARDHTLARSFATALGAHRPRKIIDLAAGSGANFRALAPLLGGDQDWLLVDHDAALLAAQATEIARWAGLQGWRCEPNDDALIVQSAGACWRVRAQMLDLVQDLERIDFAASDGVTTTAFLDLVSAAWLQQLCRQLTHSQRPLLATLTVDGRRAWSPALPADVRIQAAFQRHQGGDKGFGPALGNTAATVLASHLAANGYSVTTARSDWHIGAEHPEMLLQMVTEAAAVATEADPANVTPIAQWSAQRSAQLAAAQLALEIGHLDLLAEPAAHR
jgi:hypothetical protein